eukprot:CAMPEP_0114399736 /NCGR_PEP_ID=MMETSP0102-20121206/15839_1 /TAXON_ID=38822 ORGANISM="Pteridomonas danica, Strain PT" /NCGR_SAMPLE_ID=MMETSP0102 /ASSEMBLY_ACC=CAM_ASM_000212 /LENGTH=147 /DNA_ID=CAMNT_0001561699 /DNA_START=162 /DNA_END=605 /DNA_ORIENTATION=+
MKVVIECLEVLSSKQGIEYISFLLASEHEQLHQQCLNALIALTKYIHFRNNAIKNSIKSATNTNNNNKDDGTDTTKTTDKTDNDTDTNLHNNNISINGAVAADDDDQNDIKNNNDGNDPCSTKKCNLVLRDLPLLIGATVTDIDLKD